VKKSTKGLSRIDETQKRTFDILHFALGFKPKEKGIEEEKKGC